MTGTSSIEGVSIGMSAIGGELQLCIRVFDLVLFTAKQVACEMV